MVQRVNFILHFHWLKLNAIAAELSVLIHMFTLFLWTHLKLNFIFLSYLSESPDFPSQSIMINNSIPCCFLLFFCDFLNNFSGLFLNFCSLFRFHVKDIASSNCKKTDWSEFENVYLLLLVLRKLKKIFLNFELQEICYIVHSQIFLFLLPFLKKHSLKFLFSFKSVQDFYRSKWITSSVYSFWF